ncbi:hypothetical protein [Brevundimonas sp.]|uniref:hypothetical protein n=1 Tax=Brevundimonas sp. TaxID=1871086 RepID=UPI003A904EFE|tara:strand:- start:514 stop:819 length:306 start_codon:yes stop_codon:yes gene_type:complete
MSLMNFEAATRLWLDLADAETGDDAYCRAERVILEHLPRNDHEAVLIAEVLAESIAGGERSDGRDVIAVRNLQLWIGRSLTGEVVPIASRTLARVAARVAA